MHVTGLKKFVSKSSVAIAALLILIASPLQVLAATNNITPDAKVSFTFDDGLTSAFTQAAPTLAQYGFSGTSYVTTGCVGMSTVPNTCPEHNDTPHMTWAQLTQLK